MGDMGTRLDDGYGLLDFRARDVILAGVSALCGGMLVLAIRPASDTRVEYQDREVIKSVSVLPPNVLVVRRDHPLVLNGKPMSCQWEGEAEEGAGEGAGEVAVSVTCSEVEVNGDG